jgi:type VI secretion system protein ImpF
MKENAYRTKEDARYWPCLLRRLTDFEPEEKKESFAGAITFRQLKKDIFENIAMLLNSRSHPREKELEKWPELKESVLSYGLSDFCGRMSSRNENEEIREHILKQLLYFEPRLAADSVSVVFLANPDGSNSVLEFQIQGRIEVGELNEEIVFISKLDLETGTSSLKNTTE